MLDKDLLMLTENCDDDDNRMLNGDMKNLLYSASSYVEKSQMVIYRLIFSPFTYSSNMIKCIVYFLSFVDEEKTEKKTKKLMIG